MAPISTIQWQFNDMLERGRTRPYAVAASIFNHGVKRTMEALDLPAPRIRSIFFRTDCWERCQQAATQMLIRKGLDNGN